MRPRDRVLFASTIIVGVIGWGVVFGVALFFDVALKWFLRLWVVS